MRISSFVPAILALGLFSATTQALPTIPQQQDAVDLLKRGGSNAVDAVAKLFVKVQTSILLEACAHIEADICADVIVKLNAKVSVLELVKVNANVKDLEVRTKAAVDVDVKAKLRADINAVVIAKIDAHVHAVVAKICPNGDSACIKKNAHAIVVNVVALIKIDIEKLIVKIKAELEAHVKVRVGVHIKDLSVNVLGLANAHVSAIVRIRSDINIHLKAFIDLCVSLLVDAKLIADIQAI
ncbi:hypothetical protein BG011_009057 [Mortierella polycephala]|uniref:Transmembrane protein n=1 Tax=Mortierella polycephala TaxID=41804 RepID=A0A9P6TWV7_9FUNG|nr:hypothetical protein BG011_009057 [Mortierella polycephala]